MSSRICLGMMAASGDREFPGQGTLPTTGRPAGEAIVDEYEISLDPLASGNRILLKKTKVLPEP